MVTRLYPTIHADDPAAAQGFYGDILGLELVMDQGWVRSYAAKTQMPVQILFAQHAGSGAPLTDLSIEVDNYDDVLAKVKAAGIKIEYGPAIEPWGIKRFFVRDPFGKMVNILAHNGA